MSNPAFMFVAGDPSGDQNTAPIISQIHKEIPDSFCYGIGGPMMQAERFKSILPFEEFNRMGYVEVLSHLPFFLKAKKSLILEMKTKRPDILVCVDYSGFNMILMKAAHTLGIPVLWYIAPKVWAWKKKKHTTNLKKYAAHIATIFPFEVDIFRPYTNEVSFVGNPLVEYIDSKQYTIPSNKSEDLRNKEIIRLAIVPGSRLQEIRYILPAMVAAYKDLKYTYTNLSATVSRCGHIPEGVYQEIAGNSDIDFFDGPLEDMFSCSDLALITSGTATLQAALMAIPMVIAYKTSFINYIIIRIFVHEIKYVGLPNIIAGEGIVPECLQNEMTPESLVNTLKKYIESPDEYKNVREKLITIKEELGSKKPSEEVTRIIKRISGIDGNE